MTVIKEDISQQPYPHLHYCEAEVESSHTTQLSSQYVLIQYLGGRLTKEAADYKSPVY